MWKTASGNSQYARVIKHKKNIVSAHLSNGLPSAWKLSFNFDSVPCLFDRKDKPLSSSIAGICAGLPSREDTIKAQKPGWTDVWLVAWRNQELIKTICSKKLQTGSIARQLVPKWKPTSGLVWFQEGSGPRFAYRVLRNQPPTHNRSNTDMFYCCSSAQIADRKSKLVRDF